MDVKKKNPSMSFKDVLVLASKLKKKGSNAVELVKNKTSNAVNKISKTLKKVTGKRKTGKRKTGKRKTGKRKSGKKN